MLGHRKKISVSFLQLINFLLYIIVSYKFFIIYHCILFEKRMVSVIIKKSNETEG